ncbi:MAG: hypothetical protein E5V80_23835, partial [Mesorhizobium sp.]
MNFIVVPSVVGARCPRGGLLGQRLARANGRLRIAKRGGGCDRRGAVACEEMIGPLSAAKCLDFRSSCALFRRTLVQLISPLVGEMPGRAEGGAVPPASQLVA